MTNQNKRSGVMAQRIDPTDALDFYPTPPWATRALFENELLGESAAAMKAQSVWEPAAGEGHMAEVIKEYSSNVAATDVHDYGKGYGVGSYIGAGPDVQADKAVDWVITNPPFNKAQEFLDRALCEAVMGVAFLLRTAWLEGGDRYRDIFSQTPPTRVAVFSERVPMAKGRWDPEGSTATSYAWFIWLTEVHPGETELVWIPPGQRKALTRPTDVARFTNVEPESDLLPMELDVVA